MALAFMTEWFLPRVELGIWPPTALRSLLLSQFNALSAWNYASPILPTS
jgi:hypothetical protein